MFSTLPELLGRKFAVGFFLPTILFLIVGFSILKEFGYFTNILTINASSQLDILIGSTVLGLISWFGGITLLSLNRDILRLYEGYGRFNPVRIFSPIEKKRYSKSRNLIEDLDAQYISCIQNEIEFPPDLKIKRNKFMQDFVEDFPDNVHWLMPTSFGNKIRAFEIYPRKMYGIDSIPGWDRLCTIIPEEYSVLIDDAKAHVDFWINVSFLFSMLILGYISLTIYTRQILILWVLIPLFLTTIIAYSRAQSSAIEWGSLIKSSFDVFLPELGEKLGYTKKDAGVRNREIWEKFSQSIIYANPETLPDPPESGNN